VCGLDGTFVLTTTTFLAWDEVLGVIEASGNAGAASYSWALRQQTTQPDGSLTVQTIPCGGTSPPLCNLQSRRAHALYTPTQSLGKPGMVCPIPSMCTNGVPTFSVPLSGVRPGGSYVEPQIANVLGIRLTDPAGAWPASNTSTTNGATPVDSDEDGTVGVRQLAVLSGGELIDGAGDDDPAFNYGATSVCPRLATGSRWGYRSWPGYNFIFEFATYEWSGASRIRGYLASVNGTAGNQIVMQSNNSCLITGDLKGQGPGGTPQADARMWGCQTCQQTASDTCTPGNACTSGQVGFYDNAPQTDQRIVSSTFRLERTTMDMSAILAASGATRENLIIQACNQVRAQNCPTGQTCQ
jgi:hypothetical protein